MFQKKVSVFMYLKEMFCLEDRSYAAAIINGKVFGH